MKKLALLLTTLIALTLTFNACKDEPEDTDEPASIEKPIPESYAKKWVVNSRSVEYISIELTTEGYYFIIFNNNTSISGTCYMNGDDNIILVGYGYIEIINLENDGFSFVIHVDGSSNTETVFTTEAEEMEVTPSTELLCKTWDITQYYFILDGDTTWFQPSPVYNFTRFDVTFTSYGTYFTSEEYVYEGTPGQLYDNRYWKWADEENTEVCYGLTENSAENCEYTCGVTTLNNNTLVLEGVTTDIFGNEAHYYIKGISY